MRRILPICTVLLLVGASAICSAAEQVANSALAAALPGAVAARPLRPGEWLEYLISYPADPLEYSLQNIESAPPPPAPAEPEGETAGGTDESAYTEEIYFEPSFEPPVVWHSVPLRLEVRAVEEDSVQVWMTLDSSSADVRIPLAPDPTGNADVFYDEPQPPVTTDQYRVGDKPFAVQVVRRHAPNLGFVRLSSPDLPFGLARFATNTVDIALVGMGEGDPPAFPLPHPDNLTPAPGALYRPEEQ